MDARNIRNIVLMRPINSMIEFKQIIGRGTRLYDGKDYFTIYDFVKAHHHFSDPEWDGEPLDTASRRSRRAEAPTPRRAWANAGAGARTQRRRVREIKVKLADGKARTIQHMMVTTFWHPDGTPMSAQQFMEMLFGKLPEFFKDEAELRASGAPRTRARSCCRDWPRKASATTSWPRCKRSSTPRRATSSTCWRMSPMPCRRSPARNGPPTPKSSISTHFNSKQQVFLDFVLSHYVNVGVEELDQEKLSPLLKLKYHNSIADAVADLGRPEEIGKVFAGFQKYLYQPAA